MNKPIIFHFLNLDLFERFKQLIVTASFELNLICDFDENCVDIVFDGQKRVLDFGFKFGKFLDQSGFSFFNGNLDFG